MRSESAASEHVRLPPAEFPPYGDFAADCPARVALDLFVSRWTAVVVYALRDGPKRPSLLQAEIGEISHKVLTDTLRRLERVGLIRRHRYAEAPPPSRVRTDRAGRRPARTDLRARPLGLPTRRHGRRRLTPRRRVRMTTPHREA